MIKQGRNQFTNTTISIFFTLMYIFSEIKYHYCIIPKFLHLIQTRSYTIFINNSRCCATTSEKNVYFVIMSKREKYVKAEILTNIQCISTANKVLIIQHMKKHGWSEIRFLINF